MLSDEGSNIKNVYDSGPASSEKPLALMVNRVSSSMPVEGDTEIKPAVGGVATVKTLVTRTEGEANRIQKRRMVRLDGEWE